MATLIRRYYTSRDPQTGKKVRRKAKRWYGQYVDAGGILRRIPLATDKTAAQQMLNAIVKRQELEKAGIANPFEEQQKRTLTDHLADFRRYLEGRGNTPKHARQTCNRVQAILSGCRFVRMGDLSPSALVEWLEDERTGGRLSIQTSNYYLRDMKSFCRWLVRDNRTHRNPLEHLSGINANVDDHLERRSLLTDEFERLVTAARHGKTIRRLNGLDRAMLYIVAGNVGFRASEMASLTPASFDLDSDPPTVTVAAAYSKRRREDRQPMRPDLAAIIREWMTDKTAGARLWPGGWANHAAKMVRADLEAARATWIAEARTDDERDQRIKSDFLKYRDESGHVFDFHALRHQFISNLAAAGVHPKVAQTLARHSTITLTMDRYTHLGLVDQTAALDMLPELPSNGEPSSEVTSLKATGTDGAVTEFPCTPACTNLAQTVDTALDGVRAIDGHTGTTAETANTETQGTLRQGENDCDGVGEEAPPGFEPGMADLQSAASIPQV